MPPTATTAVEWSKLDIRRLPTLVKEVDTLVKLAPEYKVLYSDEQMHAFLLSLQSRIDDVDAMRREFAEDPRVIVVDRQLFRLRDVCIDLKSTPVVAEYNSRLHEPKSAKSAPEPTQEVKPLYRWEARKPTWRQAMASQDLNYIALKEPGHYSTRSPVENTLQLEGQFEFQIIMTEDEWRWHQKQRRQVAAESKHVERKKKADVLGVAPQQYDGI
ncbi:hypothetical protein, variant [Aphanomyces astaci]|uniref:Uncharacterized protein n=1 Tax=Aphanomyces astaci TaxID=112090 RepID=W4GMI8_APHAT|nr:hypothetical protein, variant [Aphanomyces astaci]ETV80098.1 hypothetical protein, variant [Aphanomyces astaci]|eukprot:XP_009830022.1 hypothetical protein, variant [Aphanomyces astaci]